MATTDLNAMQRWMMQALINPGAIPPESENDMLLPGPMLDAAGCLGVYQRSYILRLRKCLAEQFPATCHALGEALFRDFADEYLCACPSDSYTLYELGRRFPAWLDQTRPDRDLPAEARESWIDFMVDLAHYERTLFHLFDAPGPESDPRRPDRHVCDTALTLQPGLVLTSYRFPVAWYYHEVRAATAPGYPAPQPQHVAIVRRDYQTTTYPLSALHYRFLTTVRRLGDVDAALTEIARSTGRSRADVVGSWQTEVRDPWLEAGFFVARAAEPTGAHKPVG